MNSFFGGTISYGYDKSSNLVTVTDSRGTTTNAFDDAGVPTQITYGAGDVLRFAVDDQGRRTDSWLRTDATNTTWTAHTRQVYDTSGRVSRAIGETRVSNGTVTVQFDTSYCYNTASTSSCGTATASDRAKLHWSKDNLTGQVNVYGYDTSGRLTSVTQTGGSNPATYTYTYDARGNRLTANVTGGTSPSSQTLTFNAGNQLTTTGYTYDGTGNLTADTAGTYTYNGAQQMTKVTKPGGNQYNYKYAGTSQVEVLQQEYSARDYKLVYGRTNQVGLPVVEQVQAGTTMAWIDNDPVTGEPLMLTTAGGVQTLYVYDGLGTPVGMLTDYATVAYVNTFDPYGTGVLTGGGQGNGFLSNPFMFKGGIQDRATGWVHYGNRWYNPTLGRWTQQDTLDAPLDPANANRYAYAGADPINNIDLLGLAIGCLEQAGDVIFNVGKAFLGALTLVGAIVAIGDLIAYNQEMVDSGQVSEDGYLVCDPEWK